MQSLQQFIAQQTDYLKRLEEILEFQSQAKCKDDRFLSPVAVIHQVSLTLIQELQNKSEKSSKQIYSCFLCLRYKLQAYNTYMKNYIFSKQFLQERKYQPLTKYIELISAPNKHCQVYFKFLKELDQQSNKAQTLGMMDVLIRQNDQSIIIQEYFRTQSLYIQDLECVVNHIRPVLQPLVKKECPNFLNGLDGVLNLTQTLYKNLKFQLGINATKFAKVFCQFLPALRLYSQYLNSYNFSVQAISKAYQKHQFVIHDGNGQMSESAVSSKIGTPTKRPFSYKSFTQRLIKKMDPKEAGFLLMQKADTGLQEVIKHNDRLMDQMQKNLQLMKFEQSFGQVILDDKERHRSYIRSVPIKSIIHRKIQDSHLHIFNNLLILAIHHNPMSPHGAQRLNLRSGCYVTDVEDSKTIKHVLQVTCQSKSLTISANSPQEKAQLIKQIKQLIGNSLQFQICVLGSQQKNSTSFSKHTVYVIEVKYGLARQLLFKRYSQIKKLSVELGFKQKFQVNLMTNHKSKVIDQRKIKIAEILKKLFADKDTREKLFLMLDIDSGFLLEQLLPPLLPDNTLAGCLDRCYRSLGRFNWVVEKPISMNRQMLQLEIDCLLPQKLLVHITKSTSIKQLMDLIKRKLGLLSGLDYRICLEVASRESRIIDQDQSAYSYYNQVTVHQQTAFNKLSNYLKDKYFKIERPRLTFKKVIFLQDQLQSQSNRQDPARLKLTFHQLLNQVRSLKYMLRFQFYCILVAISVYHSHLVYGTQNKILQASVKALLPTVIRQTYQNSQWKVASRQALQKLIQSKMTAQQLQLLLYNSLKNQLTFGASMYYIQINKKTQRLYKQLNMRFQHNMWLGLRHDRVVLLLPGSKEIIQNVQYQYIEKINAYSTSLQIVSKMRTVWVNTDQSFEIFSLAQIYRRLREQIRP